MSSAAFSGSLRPDVYKIGNGPLTDDPTLRELAREVGAYPDVAAMTTPSASPWDRAPLLVPLQLEHGGHVLSLLTTLTTFGAPGDVTLDELAIELFFPADAVTAELLRPTS